MRKGAIFPSLIKVNLLADPNFIRAWPGGCGFAKMGSNYGPTLYIGVRSGGKTSRGEGRKGRAK